MKNSKLINHWSAYMQLANQRGVDIAKHIGAGNKEYAVLFGEDEIKVNFKTNKVRFKPDTEWLDAGADLSSFSKGLIEWGALVFRTDDAGEVTASVVLGMGSPLVPSLEGKDVGLPMVDGFVVAAPASIMV